MKKELEEFPSSSIAFGLAVSSYDVASKRSEIVDGGLERLRTVLVAINLAVLGITYGKIVPVRYGDCLFLISIVLLLFIVAIGSYAKSTTSFRYIHPSILYKDWIGLERQKFEIEYVRFAGINFDFNAHQIDKKSKYLTASIFSFFVQVLLLFLWLCMAVPKNP